MRYVLAAIILAFSPSAYGQSPRKNPPGIDGWTGPATPGAYRYPWEPAQPQRAPTTTPVPNRQAQDAPSPWLRFLPVSDIHENCMSMRKSGAGQKEIDGCEDLERRSIPYLRKVAHAVSELEFRNCAEIITNNPNVRLPFAVPYSSIAMCLAGTIKDRNPALSNERPEYSMRDYSTR